MFIRLGGAPSCSWAADGHRHPWFDALTEQTCSTAPPPPSSRRLRAGEVFMVGEGSVAIRLIHDYLGGDVPEIG